MRRLPLLLALVVALAAVTSSVEADPPILASLAPANPEAVSIEEAAPAAEPSLEAPDPATIQWRSGEGAECRRFNGRSMCDGPRRVPEPFGPAAELAQRLRLDERRVGRIALQGRPPAEWTQAVEGAAQEDLLWPVTAGRLWRGFGNHRELHVRGGQLRRGRARILHPGVDIGAPEGSPIRSVEGGLVLYSFNGMRGYGNSLIVLHPDATVALYAHCRALYVFAGQQIRRGQVVGEVGDTGLAHGAHLHFEWRRNGEPLDPLPLFAERPERNRPPVAAAP